MILDCVDWLVDGNVECVGCLVYMCTIAAQFRVQCVSVFVRWFMFCWMS